MNTKQKYLISLAINMATGLLLAQQAPDSTAVAQGNDSMARAASLQEAAKKPIDTAKQTVKAKDTGKKIEPVLLIKSKKDTVIVITDDFHIQKILQNVSSSVKKTRVQGYGGAGGFSNRMVAFNIQPMCDMIARGYPRSDISFSTLHDDYYPFLMSGGLGYGGLGQGIRIGGGGYGGSRKFVSNKFKNSQTGLDSTVVLTANVGFGGLLIEKAIVRNNWNYYFGSFIGGGSLNIHPEIVAASSAFSSAWQQSSVRDDINAGFMAMEMHGGFTYTIVPWMHVGGDINTLFYFSSSGFEQPWSTSFYGGAPGIGFRVIFGNIG